MSRLKNQIEIAEKIFAATVQGRKSNLMLLQNLLQKIFLELFGIRDYNPQPRRISFKLPESDLLVRVDIVPRG
jgi:hypothetical protein